MQTGADSHPRPASRRLPQPRRFPRSALALLAIRESVTLAGARQSEDRNHSSHRRTPSQQRRNTSPQQSSMLRRGHVSALVVRPQESPHRSISRAPIAREATRMMRIGFPAHGPKKCELLPVHLVPCAYFSRLDSPQSPNKRQYCLMEIGFVN